MPRTETFPRRTALIPLRKTAPIVLLAAFAALVLVTPLTGNKYWMSFLFFLFLAIVLTETFDIVNGYMGYINLGHTAFFGIGAYVYGIIVLRDGGPLLGIVLASLGSALFAALIAVPLFRLRGAYFAIATFGVLKLMEILASNLTDITGGTTGLSIPPTNSTFITFYSAAVLCLAAILLNAWVANSRLGLGLLTIREDEDVAEGAGVNTALLKHSVLVLSSVLPSIAGALYMWQTTYIDPASSFGAHTAFAPVIMAMLGGAGTVVGPVVGAIFLTGAEDGLWSQFGYLQLTMYGVVLVCIGIFMPGGLSRSPAFSRLYASAGLGNHYGYQPSRSLSNRVRENPKRKEH